MFELDLLTSLFLASVVIQLVYFWGVFSRFVFYKKKKTSSEFQPVSVVITAKNEYYNLKKNLPLILEQDYPDVEVVVVNDCSEDDTEYLLKKLSETYSHLKIATIFNNVNFFSGKKFPLSVGIKSAQNEILLLTDADCAPSSPKWIEQMQSNFIDNEDIVLGYGAYQSLPGFLNKLIRFDTIFIALQYFSYALSGIPYMGVGRNLAYKKSLFYKNKGFTKHYQVKSGDDDLFINTAATRKNISIEINKESFTYSKPKITFKDWIYQKKRHFSTSQYYKFKHKLLLGLFAFTQFSFYLLFIFLLIYSKQNIIVAISLFILRMGSFLFIFKKCMKQLDEKNLFLISPLFEIIFIFLNPVIVLSNLILTQKKWK